MSGTPSSRLRAENTTWYGWILCFPTFPCTEIESSRWSVTQFSTWQHDDRDGEADLKCTENRGQGDFSRGRARFIIRKATSGPSTNSPKWAHKKFGINVEHRAERERETQQDHRNERESAGEHSWAAVLRGSRHCQVQSRQRPWPPSWRGGVAPGTIYMILDRSGEMMLQRQRGRFNIKGFFKENRVEALVQNCCLPDSFTFMSYFIALFSFLASFGGVLRVVIYHVHII